MKAVRFHAFGGPDVLRWEDVAEPTLRPHEVLIRVAAAGVNFADLMRRQGQYSVKDALPAALGTEAAGTIARVGADVRGLSIGDHVAAALSDIFALVAAGVVRPVIDRTFPMAEAARAHEHLAGRRTQGKVLLVP